MRFNRAGKRCLKIGIPCLMAGPASKEADRTPPLTGAGIRDTNAGDHSLDRFIVYPQSKTHDEPRYVGSMLCRKSRN